MKSVFLLEHLHTQDDGEEDWKTIGVYETRECATSAIERLKAKKGFCDYPGMIDHASNDIKNGFNIDEYYLNTDHWDTGFVTEKNN